MAAACGLGEGAVREGWEVKGANAMSLGSPALHVMAAAGTAKEG